MQIRDAINLRVADRVKKCPLEEESKQAVLELLGKEFVGKYLTLPVSGSGEVCVFGNESATMASHFFVFVAVFGVLIRNPI